MKNIIINVKSLSVSYDNFYALDSVDFECRKGEFVAIVGQSGSGKSSFLNALAGFIPYTGSIHIPNSIGFIFQNYALFPWMSVENNIRFGLSNMDSKHQERRVKDLLDTIGMSDKSIQYPTQLSGGQIQRVALARALAPDPDILLMDEPYGALDYHTRDRMQNWLLSIWKESKKTVIFVTHYIEEAIFLADRIIVINNKKFISNIDVTFSRPRNDDLRFTEKFLDIKHIILDYMENNAP